MDGKGRDGKAEGNEMVEVHDLSGRKSMVRRSNLKPFVWAQGNRVFTKV